MTKPFSYRHQTFSYHNQTRQPKQVTKFIWCSQPNSF